MPADGRPFMLGAAEDLDETGKTAGQSVVVNAAADGYELTTVAGGGGADDQTAAEVPFTPAGNIAATDVQAAIEELDAEKASSGDVTAAVGALSSVYQPLDSDLSAVAALTTTVFGRGLLALADAAALLSAAGAAAVSHAHSGADITSGTVADARIAASIARDSEVTSAISALSSVYQPLDSDLTSIAALTTTAFGRGLLGLADAAALLSAAGAAAAVHVHAGEDVTSGTVADARIAATIARDSDVTAAISASEAGQVRDGDVAGGVLDGTFPSPGLAASVAGAGLAEAADVLSVNVDGSTVEISGDALQVKDGGITAAKVAADVATQAELDAHVNDTTGAHAASAISLADAGGNTAEIEVEGAIAELYGLAAGGGGGMTEVAYAEITANVQTSGGGEIAVVTAPSFTADGTSAYLIEFYSYLFANFNASTTAQLRLRLNPAGANTDMGLLAQLASSNMQVPVFVSRRLVPAAGATVYRVTLLRGGGSTDPLIGAGAGAGGNMPAFIRVSKIA